VLCDDAAIASTGIVECVIPAPDMVGGDKNTASPVKLLVSVTVKLFNIAETPEREDVSTALFPIDNVPVMLKSLIDATLLSSSLRTVLYE
jgi:hypothetical protein